MRLEQSRRLVLSLTFGVALVFGAVLPAAAAPAAPPSTLTGETLVSGLGAGAACSNSGSFSFSVTGTAAGPYTGTFTATGNGTVAAPNTVLSLNETFTIQSPQGTVTGTKKFLGQGIACYFNSTTYLIEALLAYEAMIHTPTGNYRDQGTSKATVANDAVGHFFFENFTSSLTQPVLIVPTSKDECKDGGWQNYPQFKNQGQCVSFVQHQGK